MPSPRRLIEKLEEARASRAAPTSSDGLLLRLFPQQHAFVSDKSRNTTAVCTRKAGKTFGCAARLLLAANQGPGRHALYVTLSRINAKTILWETLKQLNRECEMGGEPNESDLSLALPNGSRVFLSGASDSTEIEKFRGLSLALAIIDEAQSFPGYLKKLVDEVLAPNLMVFAGTLALIGTPGPTPVGYFYECAHSPAWTHHTWSAEQNIHLERLSGKTFQEQLDDEKKRRGVTIDDPVIQREWFGRWVLDPNALVFRFDPKENIRQPLEHDRHVMGVDLGFDDADAISVLGWTERRSPEVDLVHERVMAKQNITALAGQVREAYEKYKPLAVVADTGGLGKKIADELQMRTGIPFEAADKLRKNEHIEFVNDALRTKRLFVPKESRFAQDALLLEWDKTNPEKWTISERFHSDAADALLYAYIRALHWLHIPAKPPPPQMNTPEWYEAEMRRRKVEIDAQLEAQMQLNKNDQRESEDPLDWI